MGDGGSYSPITMRLNLIASRRSRDPALAQRIRERLLSQAISTLTSSPIDGTTIATNERERLHIGDWPDDMLDVLRTVIVTAIDQGRPAFYDWERVYEEPSITIRDGAEGVFVTFKSRPEI